MSFQIPSSRRRRVVFTRRTVPGVTRTLVSATDAPPLFRPHLSIPEYGLQQAPRTYDSYSLAVNSAYVGQNTLGDLDTSLHLPPISDAPLSPAFDLASTNSPIPNLSHPQAPTLKSKTRHLPSKALSKAEAKMEADTDYIVDPNYNIPTSFLGLPPLSDELTTSSSIDQFGTVQQCLPYLRGNYSISDRNEFGIPKLMREDHKDYVDRTLEPMRKAYVGMDASRPWCVYWAFVSKILLGGEVDSYEDRAIGNFTAAQNPSGGIGGCHGMFSHVAPTYAATLALAILGERGLETLDRRNMWAWLGRLKKPDGGFAVAEGAEVDVRGAYCSMTIISLLNLPRELPPDAPARHAGLTSFEDRLEDWLRRCQTYEGGIAGEPGTEAHGAYAFCALACACILGTPKDIIPKIFDLPKLISWLTARQYQPEGGFSGRTNKLVDGCYSHWVGGCWPLIEAALGIESDKTGGLFSREGLIRYILCCCQDDEQGGLRDKPSKLSDGYHSCYVLSGLSSAQHHVVFDSGLDQEPLSGHPFCWKPHENGSLWEGVKSLDLHKDSIVAPIHPVFVIPFEAAERTRAWGLEKTGF